MYVCIYIYIYICIHILYINKGCEPITLFKRIHYTATLQNVFYLDVQAQTVKIIFAEAELVLVCNY